MTDQEREFTTSAGSDQFYSRSRIWQCVKQPYSVFAIISAYRNGLSEEQNLQSHVELKRTVREKRYGLIEMRGGYQEETGFLYALCLFIPTIAREEAIQLGLQFNQDVILYRDSAGLCAIALRTAAGMSTSHCLSSADSTSLVLVQEKIKDFVSQLLTGSDRNEKSVLVLEEKTYVGHLSRMAGQKPEWIRIYPFPSA